MNTFDIDISLYKEGATEVLQNASRFLLDEGYELIGASDGLPPYLRDVWYLTYSDKTDTITIRQYDWRDFSDQFEVLINDVVVAKIANAELCKENFSSYLKYVIKEAL